MLKQNVEQRQSEKLGGKSLVFSWNVWKIQKRFRETCYGFCARFAQFFGNLLEIPGAIVWKSGRGFGKICHGFRVKNCCGFWAKLAQSWGTIWWLFWEHVWLFSERTAVKWNNSLSPMVLNAGSLLRFGRLDLKHCVCKQSGCHRCW